jgi:hypothetical protein
VEEEGKEDGNYPGGEKTKWKRRGRNMEIPPEVGKLSGRGGDRT